MDPLSRLCICNGSFISFKIINQGPVPDSAGHRYSGRFLTALYFLSYSPSYSPGRQASCTALHGLCISVFSGYYRLKRFVTFIWRGRRKLQVQALPKMVRENIRRWVIGGFYCFFRVYTMQGQGTELKRVPLDASGPVPPVWPWPVTP